MAGFDASISSNARRSRRSPGSCGSLGIRFYEALRGRGYAGGYDAVRRYARRWSTARGHAMATAVKRQHEPQRILGDLLRAEVSENQARSITYQLRIAKLPLAKDLEDFDFAGTPINETLVRDLAAGGAADPPGLPHPR